MAVVGMSNAEVQYTDITDQTLTSGGTIGINMDGTGADEFEMIDQGFGGTVEPGIAFNTDAGFVMVGGPAPLVEWDVIKGLTLNTTIDGSSNFHNNGVDGYIDPFWGDTKFPSDVDSYIGVTFKLGSNTHYGWIRVNWSSASTTFIIKDFAYESTANTAIKAGDKVVNVLVSSITVQGQGGVSTITMKGAPLQMEAGVLPTNASDQTVTWSVVNGTGSATISTAGLLTAAGDGTVTVTATSNDGSAKTGSAVITISNQSLATNNLSGNAIQVYPNPASEYIVISAKVQKADILSLDGKIIFSSNNIKSGEMLDIRSISTGTYIIQLIDYKGNNHTSTWQKK